MNATSRRARISVTEGQQEPGLEKSQERGIGVHLGKEKTQKNVSPKSRKGGVRERLKKHQLATLP